MRVPTLIISLLGYNLIFAQTKSTKKPSLENDSVKVEIVVP